MKRTPRGFAIYCEFKDFNGKSVRVLRSSLIVRRLVWIFPEVERASTGEYIAGAHLTVPMAKKIISALTRFVEGIE